MSIENLSISIILYKKNKFDYELLTLFFEIFMH